jgi:hypothetical protein
MTISATRAQLGHDWIRQLNRHALNRPRKARKEGGIMKNKSIAVLSMGKIHVFALVPIIFPEITDVSTGIIKVEHFRNWADCYG